jgi:hypothetical protein
MNTREKREWGKVTRSADAMKARGVPDHLIQKFVDAEYARIFKIKVPFGSHRT